MKPNQGKEKTKTGKKRENRGLWFKNTEEKAKTESVQKTNT